MNSLAYAYWIAKGVGWDNVPRRMAQSFYRRSGVLRRRLTPSLYAPKQAPWSRQSDEAILAEWAERKRRFLPIPTRDQLKRLVDDATWEASVVRPCERALQGRYPFFSHKEVELGWPPNFNRDPINAIEWPVGVLWPSIARSGPPHDDIKLVWEASRFSLAFLLARAYARSEDEHWAEAYWQLFDAWVEQNPVNETVAWACGQEIAFRSMAMLFATFSTLSSASATPARLRTLKLLCWQFGTRIAVNINYAISQENNHGLSEAVGLWTIGQLFPEFPESARWKSIALRTLVREMGRQVYRDGSYVQHSMSYHRVMLDDMCWLAALCRVNACELPPLITERVSQATKWLAEFVMERSGRVPNYGANDGANVLPLSCTGYLDYRPVIQATAALYDCGVPCSIGPWSEKALWLTGSIPETQGPRETTKSTWHAPVGGYFVMRGPRSQMMLRATRFHDRPGQCDMLHADLWFCDQSILRDAGTYRYYHKDTEKKQYFYSVRAHNTLQVDGFEQMQKGPNFLWFKWPIGAARFANDSLLESYAVCAGTPVESHNRQPINTTSYTHYRTVRKASDAFQFCDRAELGTPRGDPFEALSQMVDSVDPTIRCDGLANRGHETNVTVRWRLSPEHDWEPYGPDAFATVVDGIEYWIRISSTAPIRCHLTESVESLYYDDIQPTPAIEVHGSLSSCIVTTVGPRSDVEVLLEQQDG